MEKGVLVEVEEASANELSPRLQLVSMTWLGSSMQQWQPTVVDVPVMCDDLLDDGRSDLWLGHWWWRWWGRQGLGGGRALFHAANDYLVLDDFTLAGPSRLLARAANNKLLVLASDQLSTGARRWHRALPAPYDQGVALDAAISAVATELAARGADVEVAVALLEANGASLG